MIQDKLRNNDYYDVDNQVNKCEDKVNDFRNNYINNEIKKTMYLEIDFLHFLTNLEQVNSQKLEIFSSSLCEQIKLNSCYRFNKFRRYKEK